MNQPAVWEINDQLISACLELEQMLTVEIFPENMEI